MKSLLLLPLLTACQALTDPCFQSADAAEDRCVGEIVVDASKARTPVFDVVGTGAVVPNHLTLTAANGSSPCAGGLNLWEVKRFDEADLPLAYGDVPEGSKVWVNEDIVPEGTLVELKPGKLYTASFGAKDRIDGATSAPMGWTAVFRAGEPDSVMLLDDYCSGVDTGLP